MIRSMFTAVSALSLHQTYIDVIADNLANANTPGFKSSRMIFQDQLAQLLSPEAAPTANLGGLNPVQVGMGAQIGTNQTIFTQGTLQATGRNLDVAIQGDGFLIYKDVEGQRYSREGSLTLDANGYLVNSSTGMRVQGWMLASGATAIDTNAPVTDIQAQLDRTLAQATTSSTIAGNLNPTDNPATAAVTYNVYDSLGTAQPVKVVFTKTNTNEWTWSIAQPTGIATTGVITFDANGQPTAGTTAGPISIPGSAGADPISLTLDLTGVTQLATPGRSDVAMTFQNGVMAGRVSDVSIEQNTGKIFLQFSNGLRQSLGQIAMARFNNNAGLVRKGHTTFGASLNSGSPNIGAANNGGRGGITAGYLEASNVDMANEFTNMILAQRGFQAQTRVITTSDEMLQELVNLKR